MITDLTDEQINSKLDTLERLIAADDGKQLPALNMAFQRLIDEQVRREMERWKETDQ